METRACQNCKNDFTIEPDDFSFYEKIGVPAPTFCPECRMVRRMCWRNVRSLYKRECGLCKKSLISMYSTGHSAPVFCTDCFAGDVWNQYATGKDVDYSIPFFQQVRELFEVAPRSFAYHTGSLINSEYTNYSADNKNAYLSYSVIGCEDVMYSDSIDKSKNTLDCSSVQKLDSCYSNVDCEGNYNSCYMVNSQNCIDSYFLYDCANCQDCALSCNLRNQRFVFKNQKLTKEEYENAVLELKLTSSTGVEKTKKIFDSMLKEDAVHRYAQIINSPDVTGDHISNSRNIVYGFDVHNCENIKYASRVLLNTKDSYDLQGLAQGELIYEAVAASFGTYNDHFCYITLGSKDCEYSLILRNCSDCFGCVGLTNAKYCILNKQYEKDEYFVEVEKIKKHMMDMPFIDVIGRKYFYGEFFPHEFSPFAYNETVALDNFPIHEEEAKGRGFNWKERERREYTTTLLSKDLPDYIGEVEDSIMAETIACPNDGNTLFQCTVAYKIHPNELQFYKQKGIPLPRYCPNCRHYARLIYRNPMRLYTRTCNNGCGTEFQSTYAPDRPEKVYCEGCYQKEVL